jgi:biopolymer transport protein ExbB/TolQ
MIIAIAAGALALLLAIIAALFYNIVSRLRAMERILVDVILETQELAIRTLALRMSEESPVLTRSSESEQDKT